ncbi:MAG: TetR/AcrR family transcriptional regulator, partial [Actinomycetota bacterium]|nr:TetR/AcrR family transcriptional regulator [Actinomycetota bacterium]
MVTSPWRIQQAAATRRQIVLAARRRFAADGYSATTIEAIAAEAGVATATVYKAFGTKRAMAGALLDLIDDEAGVSRYAVTLATGEDPWALLQTAVQLDRSLFEHCGDIIAAVRGAAEVEPEFAGISAEGHRRHTADPTALADRLAALGALRADIDPTSAAGVIGMYAHHDTFALLTTHYGWTIDQCQERLTAQLCELLLGARTPPPT